MISTAPELMEMIGDAVRTRRTAMGLTQADAAARAGVAYRTWRRLESGGRASIEDLVRAAIALRAEAGLEALFPAPAAANLDELLKQQATAGSTIRRARGARRAG